MNDSVNQRVKVIIEKCAHSAAKFIVATGISQSTVSSMINKGTEPSVKTLNAIANAYPFISLNWLMTGNGNMMNKEGGIPDVPNASYPTGYMIRDIATVNSDKARLGYLSGFADPEFIESLPTTPCIVDHEFHGKYLVFETSGDSMNDGSRYSICDGDKVLCREVQRHLWLPTLHIHDYFFLVVHKTDGMVIKQITEQHPNGDIVLHSLNPLFRDYTVNLDDVAEIFNVVKIVERNMRL